MLVLINNICDMFQLQTCWNRKALNLTTGPLLGRGRSIMPDLLCLWQREGLEAQSHLVAMAFAAFLFGRRSRVFGTIASRTWWESSGKAWAHLKSCAADICRGHIEQSIPLSWPSEWCQVQPAKDQLQSCPFLKQNKNNPLSSFYSSDGVEMGLGFYNPSVHFRVVLIIFVHQCSSTGKKGSPMALVFLIRS